MSTPKTTSVNPNLVHLLNEATVDTDEDMGSAGAAAPPASDGTPDDSQMSDSDELPTVSDLPALLNALPAAELRTLLLRVLEDEEGAQKYEWPQKLAQIVDTVKLPPPAETQTQLTQKQCEEDQYNDQVLRDAAADADEGEMETKTESKPAAAVPKGEAEFLHRARYLPLRLSAEERRLLVLLERALNVSEYTDNVDVYAMRGNRPRIILDRWTQHHLHVYQQLKHICTVLAGLKVSHAFDSASKLVSEMSALKDHEELFQHIFEIGRRYKMLNPDRMRDTYGKLVYMLMDSYRHDVRLDCDLIGGRVRTVSDFIVAKCKDTALKLLTDPRFRVAVTGFSDPHEARRLAGLPTSAAERLEGIRHSVARKEQALSGLQASYASAHLSPDDVVRVVESFRDEEHFRRANKECIDSMIGYLQLYFDPEMETDGTGRPDLTSLRIQSGLNGARLNHSHNRQYNYVLQSLTLWRNVWDKIFQVWHAVDHDLLQSTGCNYRLSDTGQGLNRLCAATETYRHMSNILTKTMEKLPTQWHGSSVIHMGDHNVPNALMFIDKYSQIPRILGPIAHTLSQLDHEFESRPALRPYIEGSFGSVEDAKRLICADFFRHAFDGSGADNFFDSGSCIDGRLTSAWNWCSKIEKKSYFPLFLLTGFIGFDGSPGSF